MAEPDGVNPLNIGASFADLISTLKGVVQNLGQVHSDITALNSGIGTALGAVATATLGAALGSTNNPTATIVTNLSTTSLLVVSANSARVGITFHSPDPAGVNMWLAPSTITAVAGRGLLLTPGGSLNMPSTCGWNAIATTGSGNVLTILEFV